MLRVVLAAVSRNDAKTTEKVAAVVPRGTFACLLIS
jgi:hypothetical protein